MDDIVAEKRDHSRFGASGSPIWINCHGSTALRAKAGEAGRSGLAASEGTAAHEVAAVCIERGLDAFDMIGRTVTVEGRDFLVTAEMVEGIDVYVSHVRERTAQFPKSVVLVEHEMASDFDDEAWGSADLVIYVPGDRIVVKDLKFGRGVVVEPTSTQLMEYGWLAYEQRPDYMRGDGEPKVVELWVSQPRIPHPRGPNRRHVTNPAELQAWFFGVALPAMAANREPGALLTVGEWCRWCPARLKCPANRQAAQEIRIDLDPVQMTGEEVGAMLKKLAALDGYRAALEEEALRRARAGEKILGYKLVNKRANRTWRDGAEGALRAQYGDDAYEPRSLKGPPGIERLPGGKAVALRLAYTPVTGLTLAPESDKRPEARPMMQAFLEQEARSVAVV